MTTELPLTPIQAIQGPDLLSPLGSQVVRTRGVVTGHSRRGYFLQSPETSPDPNTSDAIFVYSPRRKARVGSEVEVIGKVVDYARGDAGRPTTQLKVLEAKRLSAKGPAIKPVWLDAKSLPRDPRKLARFLNGLEGMLVGIPAGSTFAAPSNPFGDYVCIPPGLEALRAPNGGVLVDPEIPERWLPGFKILRTKSAPKLNVGAKLLNPVVGPLSYRSAAFQMVVNEKINVEHKHIEHLKVSFEKMPEGTTIMTLNGFNLDVHVESPDLVSDPDRDIDDDLRYGRFENLARAIVKQANSPDIVALQEIQDNDGAEITDVVDASATYKQLIKDVLYFGGPKYRWADIPPRVGADGGQPGGNIRNGFLYNPSRVDLVKNGLKRVGENDQAYVDSRKPLLARFKILESGAELVVVNVHLASKRHQNGMFSPENPGFDARESARIRQAELVRDAVAEERKTGADFYLTGDFNDFEFSKTLLALCGDDCVNMVNTLPREERFDYNHRGQLQVLMHGVVSKKAHDEGRVEYEILHGNELSGIKPGSDSGKASDHAYVIARIQVKAAS